MSATILWWLLIACLVPMNTLSIALGLQLKAKYRTSIPLIILVFITWILSRIVLSEAFR